MQTETCFGCFALREQSVEFAEILTQLQSQKWHSRLQLYMLSHRSLRAETTRAVLKNVLLSSGNINGYLYSTINELQRSVNQSYLSSRWSSSSSTRWKSRQGKDYFAREARVQGLKSRAAFKLLEVGMLNCMMILKLKES
jgi:hypothetical protein